MRGIASARAGMARDCAGRRQELLSFLGGTEFFSGLTAAQLGRIAEMCSQRRFEAGTVIFDEDSESSEIFVVWEGGRSGSGSGATSGAAR